MKILSERKFVRVEPDELVIAINEFLKRGYILEDIYANTLNAREEKRLVLNYEIEFIRCGDEDE